MRVLVADDDPLMRELVETILRRGQHEVSVVSTGAEIVNMLKNGSYDLVICDIFMPGGTGIEILISLRAQNINVPFICISGGDGEMFRPYATTMRSLGATTVLQKPFSSEQLLAALTRAQSGSLM